MKIGFDATSLCRSLTGIENYTLNLVKALLKFDKRNQYILFFRKEIHKELLEYTGKFKHFVCPYQNQVFCEQFWLPYIANREKVDLIHFPAFPPGIFTSRKFIFTIHDATIWKYPETLSWKGRLYFRPFTILGACRAKKIITVSESSKNDIAQYVQRDREDIINCQEAISPVFENMTGEEKTLRETRVKYALPERFILSVNSIEPRKNIHVLLEAYKMFRKKNGDLSHKLVLTGRRAWGNDAVIRKIRELGISDDVLLTGYVPVKDLVAIYKLAEVFVYPSLYEGFGLPPLEAMACGVPVIASHIPALMEVLGEAAFFVDPHSPENISGAIYELTAYPEIRAALSQKGLERCKTFSWDKVVEKTVEVYNLIMPDLKVSLLGVQIDSVTMNQALQRIEEYIKNQGYIYITTPNVHHLILLRKDEDFRSVYRDASLVLPDGVPLLWAAKFLGVPLKEKISGSDLFPVLCAVAAERGYKVFFLGGREGAAQKAAEVLKRRYGSLQVSGWYSPPLGFENNDVENEKIIKMIKEAKPDILFVGLGAPKQEKWIYRFKDQYQVPVSIGIGVSFEFIAGMVKRAPLWMQHSGLEWFWRLMMEPRRLWKRYIIDDMSFFWLILKQKLRLLS